MTERLFMTGGTGLVGRWLIKTLKRDRPDIEITVLTRYPEQNMSLGVELIRGDVQTLKFPPGDFRYIIHCAVDETPRLLEMCEEMGAAMLYTSSGAVYGKGEKLHVPIEEQDALCLDTDYAVKKGLGEVCCLDSMAEVKIARLFTFAGGGQPLDYHYAIGNFIRDGLQGGPIVLRGGQTVYRSYLHYSEMAEWLLAILFRGKVRYPYNVGSEHAISIHDLAHDVARFFGVHVLMLPPMVGVNSWYIPNTTRIRHELGLAQRMYYPEVLYKMIEEVK